ncbi:hypothetical protein PT974_03181 [Cladobotryum mycophilum]|uniref:Small secreted protein n=1 Tax=Cladobotryum mycophilum TaxID=491253 RepID=A0ABR0SRK4_9HYPO
MQLTKALFATILAATSAAAAPTQTEVSMMVDVPQWTIEGVRRVCTDYDHVCTWTLGVNTHTAPTVWITHVVKSAGKASEANGGPTNCGDFTVTSGWSGQFGPGNGFTTFSVVDNKHRYITWPAYTDKQVEGGKVVHPNQSYGPASLPQ